MPHFRFLGFQVLGVVRRGRGANGDLFDNLEIEALQADNFLRIVREQTNAVQTEIDEDLRAKTVFAQIGLEPELLIGLDGIETPRPNTIRRHHSAHPYQYDRVPKRDERFSDPYNMGVNAEVFLYDQDFPPEPKTLMMFYKRLREVDVPEMMASIITETTGKP